MLVDPVAVADALDDLASTLNIHDSAPASVDAADERCYGCAASAVHSDRGAQGLVQKVQWRGPVRVSRTSGDG